MGMLLFMGGKPRVTSYGVMKNIYHISSAMDKVRTCSAASVRNLQNDQATSLFHQLQATLDSWSLLSTSFPRIFDSAARSGTLEANRLYKALDLPFSLYRRHG